MEVNFKFQKKESKVFIFGIWGKTSVSEIEIEDLLSQISQTNCIFDFSQLNEIDMAGMRFLLALECDLKKNDILVLKQGLNAYFKSLFESCEENYQRINEKQEKKFDLTDFFTSLGILSFDPLKILQKFINFTGALFTSLFLYTKNPKNFHFISSLYHIENSAFKALPIVILAAPLVGVVLTYQAAYQFVQFGTNILIVDLAGTSVIRGLAPLITVIVITGRSVSSYTTQIGVMRIIDKINVMNTMGFCSFELIIILRVMALIIVMPLIATLSDAISILGGVIVARINLNISFGELLRRFRGAVEMKHITIGLARAPIFGFLVGLITCFREFEVENTTQSIGIYTTKSVVNAIFWVIAFDALSSVVSTIVGV